MNEAPICEVCNKNPSIGVCAVPGVPYSAAYCSQCLAAGANPYNIVVSNTACIGGLENSADWWKVLVDKTLNHLEKSYAEFEKDVEQSIKELDKLMEDSQ